MQAIAPVCFGHLLDLSVLNSYFQLFIDWEGVGEDGQ